ncbi:hypothetical protein PL321_00640 [Caloramator sp. mosi_1]|nr:hypothetical protein [Caloramator sp. mosi_1]WDC84378.1 hypothetical protein PL321_00640 [Caloramator sp. mosi_1]
MMEVQVTKIAEDKIKEAIKNYNEKINLEYMLRQLPATVQSLVLPLMI